MAGTIPLSLTQQLDEFGKPLAGGKLYLIQAGTVSTPQNAYQDSALTLVLPNPIILDDSGRLPQFFLADGSIKIRLTKANGSEVIVADGILVVGASSGGGGGSPVDATTVLSTGDIKTKYGTGVLSGFVRLNGRTMGSASSGATERANADCQALFEYLWGADASLAVSGGRGGSANADWSANKTIALPDFRSRVIAGLSDMGNSDSTLLSGVTFTSGNATTLGSILGAATVTMLRSNLPQTSVTVAIDEHGGHGHPAASGSLGYTVVKAGTGDSNQTGGGNNVYGTANTIPLATTGITAAFDLNGNVTQTAMNKMPPAVLITIYVKL